MNSKNPSIAIAKSSERKSDLISTFVHFLINFFIISNLEDYSPNLVFIINFKIPTVRTLNK